MEPAQLYLDLLKRCLLDLIHVDGPLAAMVPAGLAHRPRALRLMNRTLGRATTICKGPPWWCYV